jgi:hypothetical protein
MAHFALTKVVDFNAVARTESLEQFFAENPKNVAVLTDLMGIECLKRSGIENYRRSFVVLSRFADRALVLKPYQDLCRVRPSRAEFPEWLIDHDATVNLPRYTRLIAETKDPRNLAIIQAEQTKTQRVMQKIEKLVDEELRQAISEVSAVVPADQLSRWGKSAELSAEELRLAHGMAVGITAPQYRKFFPGFPEPCRDDALLWMPYRHAVAVQALTLKWLKAGGHETARSDTLRNDSVDIFYVMYGSLFDGVISGDLKLQEIVAMTKAILAYGEAQKK